MAGETNVGSIVGFLRLDADQFHEQIARAIAELKVLSGTDVNIHVDATGLHNVDTAAAGAVRSLDDVDQAATRVGNNGSHQVGLLSAAMFTLGPALVPLSAGVAGLGAGFGGMAAAGILAFSGIRREMAAGSALGLQYQAGVDRITSSFNQLSSIAAQNVLGNFQLVVDTLTSRMPFLSQAISNLSTITGHAAAEFSIGLLNAFQTLMPMIQDAAVHIDTLAAKFEAFGSSNGLRSFGDYVSGVMPGVIHFISELITAVIHLAEAIAPFGSGILSILEVFINALNSMPIPLLTQLAQLALSVFAGFKTWEALTGIIEGVVEALKALNVTLEISEGVLKNLDLAASVIGIAIAALSLILAHNAEVTEEAKTKQEAYSEALRESNGAIDDAVRAIAAKALAEEGAFQDAQALGLSLSDVTSAALGQKDAFDRVNAVLNAYSTTGTKAAQAGQAGVVVQDAQAKAADRLRESIGGQNTALNAEISHQSELRAAMKQATGDMTAQESATTRLAARYGMTTTAYEAATKAQKDDAAALATTTAKMQMENNAAGLLKAALDALNGKAITAAQAQQQFDSSLVNMTHAQDAAGNKVRVTTGNINSQTVASVGVRGSLNQQVTALEAVVEANGGLSNSTGHARAQMETMRTQIINNAVAHGVDRAAVTRYIDTLLRIPRSIPPTKLQVDSGAALNAINNFKAQLASVNGRTVTTYIRTYSTTYDTMGGVGGVSGHGVLTRFRGGIDSFREGGFRGSTITAFADGKLPGQAMIAPDGSNIINWAESGTGGEAFIPLGLGNRANSIPIWEETGRRLGVLGQNGPVRLDNDSIERLAAALMRAAEAGSARGTAAGMDAFAARSVVSSRAQNGVNR